MTSSRVIQDQHVARRLKVLNGTSASQIDRWEQCERQWFGGYVEGEWAPQSEAQARGTAIDLEVQRHYRGEPVAAGWRAAVDGIVRLLPPNPRIQHKILVPTYDGGPMLVGYPDFLYEIEPRSLLILDLKSLSDYRYAKTAAQLATNTQMVTYSAWGWMLPEVERVRVGHLAARFKKDAKHPVGYRLMDARMSELAEMERGRTLDLWGAKLGKVRTMVAAANSAVKFEDLAPTGSADADEFGKSGCERFGGCHFRGRCGFAVSMQVSKTFNLGETTMSNGPSLMEQLEAMKQAAQQPQVVPGAPGNTMTIHLNPSAIVAAMTPSPFPPAPTAGPHAHPGALGLEGYAPKQPCNGQGYYANQGGNGGFIAVEPGHMCAACVGPATIDPRQALPPDAPGRTSTPAEIEAVVEGKRKKAKKSANNASDDVIAIYGRLSAAGYSTDEIGRLVKSGEAAAIIARLDAPAQLAPKEETEARSQLPVADVPAPSAIAAAQAQWYQQGGPPATSAYGHSIAPNDVNGQAYAQLEARGFTLDEAVNNMLQQQAAAQATLDRMTPQQLSSRPPAGLVLLVDCAPVKGAPAVLLADWLAPVLEHACRSVLDDAGRPAPVTDLRLVPFARGKGYLGAAVRLALGTVPPVLAVDTTQYGADVALEALTAWASTIIRGGAR